MCVCEVIRRCVRVRSSYTKWEVTPLNYTDHTEGVLPLHGHHNTIQTQQPASFSTASLAAAVGVGYRVRSAVRSLTHVLIQTLPAIDFLIHN